MTKPKYKGITNSEINRYKFPNNDGLVEVIAAEYNKTFACVATFTPVNLFKVKLN